MSANTATDATVVTEARDHENTSQEDVAPMPEIENGGDNKNAAPETSSQAKR